MKNFLLFLAFILCLPCCFANKPDSIFAALNYAIKNKELYVKEKEKTIAGYKRMLSGDLSLEKEYDCNGNLYKEYRKFKLDSAIYYVKKNLRISKALSNNELDQQAQLQLANLYSSSGRYRESEIILKGISTKNLSKVLLPIYYEAYSQFFEHYSTNTYNEQYVTYIEVYRDSLLSVLDTASVKYKINLAQKNIYNKNVTEAQNSLLTLLKTAKSKDQDYAMIAYLLGDTFKMQDKPEQAKEYYIISATADITNAIKDNASVQNLALMYYEAGDIDNAYIFTKSAIADAIFCNVKFRTLQMSELYSIINTAYLDKEARSKQQLQTYLILISVLSLFLILAVVYVYKQMKKVSRIKEELGNTSSKLADLNTDISRANSELQERNAQLFEANHVKEEYIAHFFDLCSTYINKLENYRKALNKKANDKQLDELFKMLKSTTVVDNELEELYENFDSIFLNLYPTFVKDFNALLVKDEQVTLKQGELLNTELRIFALIRLGITDSVKIAAFLRYSLSTIYNYRTKARNKAAVSRDAFEVMVSKIGNIPDKSL
ncbi:DUF6377 domain-containing protein [Flavobacterium subsaxonicum]|uniref:Regulatory protein n=1 Tax=Flavobacterium subsaxonicum WB 4.1-42 = DSM 21790 TaxID=1121898 RepID=A0A0A2MJH1_9FLAO|nr:DUF6377 domain-containing protein [Flavobacterium subsaxonicum]KGO91706.1 regulatory protein [Flavobacterium subsaxonicum WB 4.1-42 = DSM 21790]